MPIDEKNRVTTRLEGAGEARRPSQTKSAPPDDAAAPPNENPGGLVRVTVNLTPKSASALDHLSRVTALSKTDVINRSLQVYQVVEDLLDRGGGSILVKHQNGELERVYIL